MKKFIIAIFFFCAVPVLKSQEALLWSISNSKGEKISYLFGTIHLECNPKLIATAEFANAIQGSEILITEINLSDFSTFIAYNKLGMRSGTKPISSFLTVQEKEILNKACLRYFGDSLTIFNSLKPSMLYSKFISSDSITGCRPVPYDLLIAEMGRAYGLSNVGFETVEFQDSMMNLISDSIWVRELVAFSKDPGKYRKLFKELSEAYNRQDLNSLLKAIQASDSGMKMDEEVFINSRNRNWIAILKPLLLTNSVFIAVGAGHLPGPEGLIELLRNAGFIVTPIRIKY